MKKTIFIFILFFAYLPRLLTEETDPIVFDNLQLNYLHSDKKKEVNGSSIEFHLKDKHYHYLYTKLYGKEKTDLRKARLIVLTSQKKLLYFYETNFKRKEIFFNQYLPEGNSYSRKIENKEWKTKKNGADGGITIEEFLFKLKLQVQQKKFKKEVWKFYLPYLPAINHVKMNVQCQPKVTDLYFKKKEATIFCHFALKSSWIRSFVSEDKAEGAFVFQQEYPHYILKIILGNHFYLTEKKTITKENRENLLQEIDEIKNTISRTQQKL